MLKSNFLHMIFGHNFDHQSKFYSILIHTGDLRISVDTIWLLILNISIFPSKMDRWWSLVFTYFQGPRAQGPLCDGTMILPAKQVHWQNGCVPSLPPEKNLLLYHYYHLWGNQHPLSSYNRYNLGYNLGSQAFELPFDVCPPRFSCPPQACPRSNDISWVSRPLIASFASLRRRQQWTRRLAWCRIGDPGVCQNLWRYYMAMNQYLWKYHL